MRTHGGGGVKKGQILWTSFMDGPLSRYADSLHSIILSIEPNKVINFSLTHRHLIDL